MKEKINDFINKCLFRAYASISKTAIMMYKFDSSDIINKVKRDLSIKFSEELFDVKNNFHEVDIQETLTKEIHIELYCFTKDELLDLINMIKDDNE